MSGGSFNYLAFEDSTKLIRRVDDIRHMADALEETGYAQDAAEETGIILLLLCEVHQKLEAHRKNLETVWHAMEWWKSGDHTENDFKKALETYRSTQNFGHPLTT